MRTLLSGALVCVTGVPGDLTPHFYLPVGPAFQNKDTKQ